MENFEEHLKATIRKGKRRQEPLNPCKYPYVCESDDLPEESNHLVAIALFGFNVDAGGETIPNNYIVTAFMKHIRPKGGKQ